MRYGSIYHTWAFWPDISINLYMPKKVCGLTTFHNLFRCLRVQLSSFELADASPPPQGRRRALPKLGFSSPAFLVCLADPNVAIQLQLYHYLLDHKISARCPEP